MRILSWKDVALSAASGYIVYTLPLWVKQEAARYAGIVAWLAAVYILIALNEIERQKRRKNVLRKDSDKNTEWELQDMW